MEKIDKFRLIFSNIFLFLSFLLLGRVHSAIVSGVNWEQRTVTVEWFEKGETKGKEVSHCERIVCVIVDA